jgi:hypothetical protein
LKEFTKNEKPPVRQERVAFSKEGPRMTSQSDDDKYSQNHESHQDDDLLKDLVLDLNAEDTDEEIIAVLEQGGVVNDHNVEPTNLVQPASIDPLVAASVDSDIEADNLATSSRGQFDKLAKRNRPISMLRDAAFVRDLEALLAAEASTSGRETSVSSHTCSSLTLSYPSLTNLASSRERPSEQGKSPRDPRAAWWHVLLAKPAHDYRVPATWRDTSDQLRILYRHLALREFGEVHSFTLNLKPDIEERARSQSNPAGWFHDRIVHHLKAVLRKLPEFHFVLEEAEAHRLHVHGEIQCTSAETAAVRKALRLAGGEWDLVRQHQAHTDNDPDQGWASYISKDLWKIRFTRDFLPKYGNPRSSYAITFSGNAISTTRSLGQKAAELFAQHREMLVRVQKAKKNASPQQGTPE